MPLIHRALRIANLPYPDGIAINPSLTQCPQTGRLILAYRYGWESSQIAVCEVDADYQPVTTPKVLELGQLDFDADSQEDPRLWWQDSELWVTYTGTRWVDKAAKALLVSVCIAKLNPQTLEAVEAVYPHLDGRNPSEKNWGAFFHAGQMHVVYSICPHVVLRIDEAVATEVAREPWTPRWHVTMRGGASPVKVGDEWWSWFHGCYDAETHRRYVGGLYTFDAFPPFRPRRMVPQVILSAHDDTRPLESGRKDMYDHPNVIYTSGAFLKDGKWIISYGTHDQWCDVIELDHAAIEGMMVSV